jgi:hypothetical protein
VLLLAVVLVVYDEVYAGYCGADIAIAVYGGSFCVAI